MARFVVSALGDAMSQLQHDLDHAGHSLFQQLEHAAARVRDHFNDHPLWEPIVQHLDDLISASRKLKDERAILLVDRDAERARADKAEGELATLKAQVVDDEAKAEAAAKEVLAEVDAEAPGKAVEVTVAAPTTAPTVTIPVSAEVAANTAVGSVLAGPGVSDGATVTGTTDNHPQTGGPALTIDDATTADHVGGETLTITAPAQ